VKTEVTDCGMTLRIYEAGSFIQVTSNISRTIAPRAIS